MARLLADENFDFQVVCALRAHGHDMLTVQQAGMGYRGVADEDVLAFPISEQRAVVTFDKLDYIRLNRQVSPHCGIIICSDDRNRLALAQRIHDAIAELPDLTNQLIRVYRPNTP